ncbi:hypothetical protein E4T80_09925 [Muribacter muris]|uniref:Uncharacterized protein n=1 Tax=Muribacter muris TaxID=67855 RepID=A0A4Y9JSQ1_9PAST|nr:hypothetical protein [Muribacter muris]MBF0785776.1 hypothetical protein [Muribacter muris]MBF0828252.1 hypothetical protein [Muribacter muris]TFV08598.1 hypothetical protein E4T80_09925 [Muribacter muris]
MSCNCIKPKCGTQQAAVFSCADNDGRDVEFIGLDEFLPRVTLVAKGVPDDVALEYLRQAAMTLARESRLLKRELHLDVQAGVRDYYLHAGDNEQVHLIHSVQYGKGADRCGCASSSCFVALKACRSNVFSFEPPDKVILTKAPKADGEDRLFVQYVAMPTQNACEVDKLLFDRYHEVVVNGALANLLLMRQYEFADPQMAMFYETRFKQGIAQAKIDTMRQFETGTQKLAYGGLL